MEMKVSVIIPTCNGANKIKTLLFSLLEQKEKGFEVIVIIDGSTDNTMEVLKSFEPAFKDFKIISQTNKGRSHARNKGVPATSGEVLIFYDDDMELDPDSVGRYIWFHKNYSGIVGGDPVEFMNSKKTEIQNYKAHLTSIWTAKYPKGLTQLNHLNLFFTAANCSVRRNTFLMLNGFDERLTDVEDYDFAYRALEKGISVFFDKSNKAVHHDLITAKSYVQRLRLYGEAHSRLVELHPERKEYIVAKSKMKRVFYRVVASSFLVRLIDYEFFKNILPEAIRFKIYDLVIQALAVEFPRKPL